MTSDNLRKKIREIVFTILSFALGISLLIYTFRGVNFIDVWNILEEADIFYLMFFIFIVYVGVFFRALRWKFILESIKSDIKLTNLFNAVIIGYGVNVILPRFGEIFRAIFLAKREKISRGSSIGTIFIERIIDLLFLLISVFLSLMVLPDKLIEVYPWLYSSIYIAILGLIGIFILIFILVRFQSNLVHLLDKIFKSEKYAFINNISINVHKIIDGFNTIKSYRSYALIFISSALIWFSYAAGAFYALKIFHLDTSPDINFSAGLIIMSITTFGVMVPTPAGTGSYHAFCKSVLTMIYGFNVKVSLAYALLTHFINSVPFLIITIIYYLIFRKKDLNILDESDEKN